MILIGGIDPGKKGAFVTVTPDGMHVEHVMRVPLSTEKHNHRDRKPTIKTNVDYPSLCEEWGIVMRKCKFIIFEHIWGAAPAGKGRKDGGASMFKLGHVTGFVYGVAQTWSVPVFFRTPQTWRKIVSLEGGKDQSFVKARALFPDSLAEFKRVSMDEGVAEASLIAYSGVLEPPGDFHGSD
jgi:hypothetical protein